MERERLFYHLYDLKKEEMPSEEEWEVRIDQLEVGTWQPPVEGVGQQSSGQQPVGQQPFGQQSSGQQRSGQPVGQQPSKEQELGENSQSTKHEL